MMMKVTVRQLKRLIREEFESPSTLVSPGSQGGNTPSSRWDEKVLRKVMGRLVSMMTLADEVVEMVDHQPDLQAKLATARKLIRQALNDVNDTV